jgi:hypothetical protein
MLDANAVPSAKCMSIGLSARNGLRLIRRTRTASQPAMAPLEVNDGDVTWTVTAATVVQHAALTVYAIFPAAPPPTQQPLVP